MLFICHQMAMEKEAQDKQRIIIAEDHLKQVKQVEVPVIWVLGGPGCGKGTQCAKIVERYGYEHFSTGDLLRAEVASGSDKGKQLQQLMSQGKLVSNDDVLEVLQRALVQILDKASGFLIDGYPREKDQGSAFERVVCPVDLVVFFDCSDDTMTKRILHRAAQSVEKRADDNEASIKIRLETFRKNTNEILANYTDRTIIINAERPVDQIFSEVVNAIDAAVARKKSAAAI